MGKMDTILEIDNAERQIRPRRQMRFLPDESDRWIRCKEADKSD